MEKPSQENLQVNEKTNLYKRKLDDFLNEIRGYLVVGFEEFSGEDLESKFNEYFEKTEEGAFELRLQQTYSLFSARLGVGEGNRLTRALLFTEPILKMVCDRVAKAGATQQGKILPFKNRH